MVSGSSVIRSPIRLVASLFHVFLIYSLFLLLLFLRHIITNTDISRESNESPTHKPHYIKKDVLDLVSAGISILKVSCSTTLTVTPNFRIINGDIYGNPYKQVICY